MAKVGLIENALKNPLYEGFLMQNRVISEVMEKYQDN